MKYLRSPLHKILYIFGFIVFLLAILAALGIVIGRSITESARFTNDTKDTLEISEFGYTNYKLTEVELSSPIALAVGQNYIGNGENNECVFVRNLSSGVARSIKLQGQKLTRLQARTYWLSPIVYEYSLSDVLTKGQPCEYDLSHLEMNHTYACERGTGNNCEVPKDAIVQKLNGVKTVYPGVGVEMAKQLRSAIIKAPNAAAALPLVLALHGITSNESEFGKWVVVKTVASPDGRQTVVVFGDDQEDVGKNPMIISRGFYVLGEGGHRIENWHIVTGAWEHLSIGKVWWFNESTIKYEDEVVDEGGVYKEIKIFNVLK